MQQGRERCARGLFRQVWERAGAGAPRCATAVHVLRSAAASRSHLCLGRQHEDLWPWGCEGAGPGGWVWWGGAWQGAASPAGTAGHGMHSMHSAPQHAQRALSTGVIADSAVLLAMSSAPWITCACVRVELCDEGCAAGGTRFGPTVPSANRRPQARLPAGCAPRLCGAAVTPPALRRASASTPRPPPQARRGWTRAP